jgi:hypothetical protein
MEIHPVPGTKKLEALEVSGMTVSDESRINLTSYVSASHMSKPTFT